MDREIVYGLLFLVSAFAAWQLQRALDIFLRSRRSVRRRFETLPEPRSYGGLEIRRRRSRFGGSALARSAGRLLAQSGTRLSPHALVATAAMIAVAVFLFAPIPDPALRLAAATLVGCVAVVGALRRARARRMRRFGEQLPDVLDVIVRSLRAGHPLPVSLGLVAREMPEPAGPEFAVVVDEISYGRSMAEALENLHDRVGYPELRFFVASTAIAQQTGGNLGEILGRLSRMLRERFRFGRRVRSLSAEGRFSGIALSILPAALFGLINLVSPSYYAEFWASPSSSAIISLCIGLLLVGNLLIYRLVKVEV